MCRSVRLWDNVPAAHGHSEAAPVALRGSRRAVSSLICSRTGRSRRRRRRPGRCRRPGRSRRRRAGRDDARRRGPPLVQKLGEQRAHQVAVRKRRARAGRPAGHASRVVGLHPALAAAGVDDRAGGALGPIPGPGGAQQTQPRRRSPDVGQRLAPQVAGHEGRIAGRDRAGVDRAVGVDRQVPAAGRAEVLGLRQPAAPGRQIVDRQAELAGDGDGARAGRRASRRRSARARGCRAVRRADEAGSGAAG